jgi:hypothetical protein
VLIIVVFFIAAYDRQKAFALNSSLSALRGKMICQRSRQVPIAAVPNVPQKKGVARAETAIQYSIQSVN